MLAQILDLSSGEPKQPAVIERFAARIVSTTSGSPRRSLIQVNSVLPSPRIMAASLAMTSKSAPTISARSILLMTRRSDWVIPGPPFRGILSTTCDVDDVNRVIHQLPAEMRGKIISSAFHEQNVDSAAITNHEILESRQIHADIISDGGMGTSAGFNCEDSLRFQGLVSGEEFRVLSSENVVCDNPQTVLVPKVRAECMQ